MERRSAPRHTVLAGGVVEIDTGGSTYRARVKDISAGGCRIETDALLPPEITSLKIRFPRRDGAQDDGCNAKIVGKPDHDSQRGWTTYQLKFKSALSTHASTSFGSFVDAPADDRQTQRSVFELQQRLALLDIELIDATIRDLKVRQFQLFISGLPLFVGLLGTTFSFLLSTAKTPWWVMFLPLASLMLAVPMFAVFLQKSASLARHGAFKLLLQQYLVLGRFPAGYRGWEDAYASLNYAVKFGLKANSPLHVPKLPHRVVRRRLIPGDSFKILNTGLFIAIPFIAVAAIFAISQKTASDALGWHTFVVVLMTVTLVGCYAWVALYGWQVSRGKQSFDAMVVRFGKILDCLPPYDPYRPDQY
ncbi:MAG: hypothetical protein DCC71_18885 [Proteobacteria bacterium]|nr:MAG: hypothetical protein DCC71_18885 [Pseudomonadota bacterium]